MSTPEALHEFDREHEADVEMVIEKLGKRVSDIEKLRIRSILHNEHPALFAGEGFKIFRDLENHYDVRFDDEPKRAA